MSMDILPEKYMIIKECNRNGRNKKHLTKLKKYLQQPHQQTQHGQGKNQGS